MMQLSASKFFLYALAEKMCVGGVEYEEKWRERGGRVKKLPPSSANSTIV
jgi:hypothetical protein